MATQILQHFVRVVVVFILIGLGWAIRNFPRKWRRNPSTYRIPRLFRWPMLGIAFVGLPLTILPLVSSQVGIAPSLFGIGFMLLGGLLYWGFSSFYMHLGDETIDARKMFSFRAASFPYGEIRSITEERPNVVAVNYHLIGRSGEKLLTVPGTLINTKELFARIQYHEQLESQKLLERHSIAINSGHSDAGLRQQFLEKLSSGREAFVGHTSVNIPDFFFGNADNSSFGPRHPHGPHISAFHSALSAIQNDPRVHEVAIHVENTASGVHGAYGGTSWPRANGITVTELPRHEYVPLTASDLIHYLPEGAAPQHVESTDTSAGMRQFHVWCQAVSFVNLQADADLPP